jgi:hypothetical protein
VERHRPDGHRTGIEGLNISARNNISFAKGEDYCIPRNEDSALFFSPYNAIGVTIEISEKLNVNVEIGNILSKTKYHWQTHDVWLW